MGKKRDKQKSSEARQREELQGFFQHLIVFTVVNVVLITIDLLTPGGFWFFWVTLFWGIGLAIQGFNVLALDRRLTDRIMGTSDDATSVASSRKSEPPPPVASNGVELHEIADRASALIDTMRASARRIPDADARREALDACAASDQVLAALVDHPDEITIARDFLHRFLEPAGTVIGDYARLASRNVPSARETLRQVEEHDLPLITHRANQVYDRLHRGTLIDLEVAREMLTLDMAGTALPESAPNR